MSSEKSIVNAITKNLDKRGWWAMKIHGGVYQLAGFPDLLCLKDGRWVLLEVKRPGKKTTRIQNVMHETLRSRGAEVYVVYSVEDAVYRCEVQA